MVHMRVGDKIDRLLSSTDVDRGPWSAISKCRLLKSDSWFILLLHGQRLSAHTAEH